MWGRLRIYLKEMYPVLPRLFVAGLVFFEIYFVLLLNQKVTRFYLNHQELIGVFTVFAFLLFLRIADDFKDYETDRLMFPQRPLPSGRVRKSDLRGLLVLVLAPALVLNFLWMNNLVWFLLLFGYGLAMSVWFFARERIRNSLLLAVVTHNPVLMILNLYIISFTVIKYGLPAVTLPAVLLAFSLYFPGLIWEVARKIRAPREETKYVTYSSLWGVRRATRFVQVLTLVDILTNLILIWSINRPLAAALAANVAVMTRDFSRFIADPDRFRLIDKVERYTILTESIMVAAVAIHLLLGPA